MRVAFDEQIFAAQRYGGISRLFAELARQFVSNPDLEVDLMPLSSPVINRYLLDDPFLRSALDVRESAGTLRSLGRYFTHVRPRTRVDVIHNTFYLPHGLAGYPGARRVVTIHDMIPELLPQTRRRLDFITLKKHYVAKADHVICVSEATKEDLLSTYGPVKADVSVVHHGVDPIFSPGAAPVVGLPERYVVFVGNRGQYKDADVLIRAFAGLEDSDLHLVFVGGGPFTRGEHETMERCGVVRRCLQVSLRDAEMPGAYGNAQMCVFPSRFEGFGLPALESMACGTPVILARATSLPEVGGDAAWYFTPGDADDLGSQMSGLMVDEAARGSLRVRGLARAATFTWHKAARSTAEIYSSLVR